MRRFNQLVQLLSPERMDFTISGHNLHCRVGATRFNWKQVEQIAEMPDESRDEVVSVIEFNNVETLKEALKPSADELIIEIGNNEYKRYGRGGHYRITNTLYSSNPAQGLSIQNNQALLKILHSALKDTKTATISRTSREGNGAYYILDTDNEQVGFWATVLETNQLEIVGLERKAAITVQDSTELYKFVAGIKKNAEYPLTIQFNSHVMTIKLESKERGEFSTKLEITNPQKFAGKLGITIDELRYITDTLPKHDKQAKSKTMNLTILESHNARFIEASKDTSKVLLFSLERDEKAIADKNAKEVAREAAIAKRKEEEEARRRQRQDALKEMAIAEARTRGFTKIYIEDKDLSPHDLQGNKLRSASLEAPYCYVRHLDKVSGHENATEAKKSVLLVIVKTDNPRFFNQEILVTLPEAPNPTPYPHHRIPTTQPAIVAIPTATGKTYMYNNSIIMQIEEHDIEPIVEEVEEVEEVAAQSPCLAIVPYQPAQAAQVTPTAAAATAKQATAPATQPAQPAQEEEEEEAATAKRERINYLAEEAAYEQLLAQLSMLPGKLKIELIGTWVWVSGDTKPVKEELKKLGFSWHSKKVCWYLALSGKYRPNRRASSNKMDIKRKYGVTTILDTI